MANEKITGLTEKTSIASDDLFEIVDSVTGINKKIKSSKVLIEANIWHVNPSASGGDGTPQNPYTVNEAIAVASDSDIIFFQAGTYTTDISVSKNLYFLGYSKELCKITVTNFLFDTASATVTLFLDNLQLTITNSITQGGNNAFLTIMNSYLTCSNDIILERVKAYQSSVAANDITTGSHTSVYDSFIATGTFTIDGTSTFNRVTINANISAATRTLIFYNAFIDGDITCANLTYNNTAITGTKTGTSSTTVNNQ